MDTILLIEDNADILDNLTEYLELEGYSIIGTNNGSQGIRLALEFLPDLIICDVVMREMNGLEVLRQLLRTAKISEIPFIFSTSLSESINRETSKKLGAVDYIIKPFDMESLLKMVAIWVNTSQKNQQFIF